MNTENIDLHEALKKNFGFSKFKGLQEEVIKSVMNNRDTFVIMPTGEVNRYVTNYRPWQKKEQQLLFHH